MSDALEQVAFDIETTGFTVDDEVTVIGFGFEMGTRVFLHGAGESEAELEAQVREQSGHSVNLSTHPSEEALLIAVGEFGHSRLTRGELLLVAFNGERWKSGFDLPFLRTRLAKNDVDWPFSDLPYADLLPVLEHRFNTVSGDGESRTDLVGVSETLLDGTWSQLDPFADSAEAVTAFESGAYVDLLLHNLADVRRTLELGRLTQRYCSKSDYDLKSLTPTVEG